MIVVIQIQQENAYGRGFVGMHMKDTMIIAFIITKSAYGTFLEGTPGLPSLKDGAKRSMLWFRVQALGGRIWGKNYRAALN